MRSGTVALGFVLILAAGACGGEAAPAHRLVADGRPAVLVEVPESAGLGLSVAAADLREAIATIGGADPELDPVARTTVRVEVDPAEGAAVGSEGYRFAREGAGVLRVRAATEIGAVYGLYDLAMRLGVRWYHPEETFHPSDPEAVLPWDELPEEPQTPDFALRGFHEHTQHPIPMSDFLFRPEDPGFRDHLSSYLRWLARNRQNVLFFHFLETVDLESWVPRMQEVVAEAHALGVRVGAVVGFVDQQQNAYAMIDLGSAGGGSGEDEALQIAAGLDRVLAAGLDYVGLQIGTSEFTKPDDGAVLGWLQIARDHLESAWPDVTPFSWIHITCSLRADDGSPFYHLPLQASPELGAFVHTTMFYSLEHPAPVYDCEDFSHQVDFLESASGERPLVYFPETAWWLGFDNNVPLALPLTAWARAHDVREVLPAFEVEGHVTFTTGREWTYWQYDHFLTRLTWDRDSSWEDYLAWIAPAYGEHGDVVRDALLAWTELQRKHFFEEDPLLWFYLAGELPQDELGEQAGILARRPKLAFQSVLHMDESDFAAWEAGDLGALRSMRDEYEAALPDLPGDAAPLVREVADALSVYVRRIEHAIALYEGVAEARRFRVEEEAEPPDESALETAKLAAEAKLALARSITDEVRGVFEAAESRYRYPVSILARPKPSSPTVYPFGYLAETSTAYFWSRRDDQLEALLAEVFDGAAEAWTEAPALVFTTGPDLLEMLVPEDDVAGGVLASFMPPMLFGLRDDAVSSGAGALVLAVAEDADLSGLPDPGTEVPVAGVLASDGTFTAAGTVHPIHVRDGAGVELGILTLHDPTYTAALSPAGAAVETLESAEIAASFDVQVLVDIVLAIGGIDREGIENLLRGVFDLDPEAPLPDTLPVHLRFTFE